MANRTQTIIIDSILGGHSPLTDFAGSNQFRASLGIDPGSPINGDNTNIYGIRASGLLRPMMSLGRGAPSANPIWIEGGRQTTTVFVYDSNGSIYTTSWDQSSITELASVPYSNGNGMAYYDNYMYFATNSDIARYGPLDGTTTLTESYWSGVLGKTSLENPTYPLHSTGGAYDYLPNHFLHRHSDGRLYIADMVDNQATIHYIQTTKTTIEGDTDDGSTYDKINLGYGLAPSCMESFGEQLVIALFEKSPAPPGSLGSTRSKGTRAKLAFWDTTSEKINQITWVEFPDTLITAMKNVNGVLYLFSTPTLGGRGYRVSRYVGGNTIEEIWSANDGYSPFPGAIDGAGDRLLFGSRTVVPVTRGCVFSLGLSQGGLSNGLFCPYTVATTDDVSVTALLLAGNTQKMTDHPIFGYGNTADSFGINATSAGVYSNVGQYFWSQMYSIGRPFKITKIVIPLASPLDANTTITPKLYTDNGYGNAYTLTAINTTKYSSKRRIVIRPTNATGDNNFWLELKWSITSVTTLTNETTVGLPIIIEYELIDE